MNNDEHRSLRHWSWKIGERLFGLQMHLASPRGFLARFYDRTRIALDGPGVLPVG